VAAKLYELGSFVIYWGNHEQAKLRHIHHVPDPRKAAQFYMRASA